MSDIGQLGLEKGARRRIPPGAITARQLVEGFNPTPAQRRAFLGAMAPKVRGEPSVALKGLPVKNRPRRSGWA
jgi:hypothetical protein